MVKTTKNIAGDSEAAVNAPTTSRKPRSGNKKDVAVDAPEPAKADKAKASRKRNAPAAKVEVLNVEGSDDEVEVAEPQAKKPAAKAAGKEKKPSAKASGKENGNGAPVDEQDEANEEQENTEPKETVKKTAKKTAGKQPKNSKPEDTPAEAEDDAAVIVVNDQQEDVPKADNKKKGASTSNGVGAADKTKSIQEIKNKLEELERQTQEFASAQAKKINNALGLLQQLAE